MPVAMPFPAPDHAPAWPRRAGRGWARGALVTGLIALMLVVSGCDRIRLHGSGGSSSEPDIGVGVEL